MINNPIKYPIALNKKTKKIININNVTSKDKNKLICYSCQNDFIAIINHQTPHFRHKPESNCNSNVESYIHWLTKEVFKEIKTINLPKITFSNLNESQRENVNFEIENLLSKNNIPFGLRNRFKQKLKKKYI